MKLAKLGIVAILAIFITAAIAALPKRLCFESGKYYTFYCGTSSADCREVTVTSKAALERLKLKDVCGESTVYENFDMESFIEKVHGELVFSEEFSDCVNYYLKADLPYSVNLNGKEINLHIAVRGNVTKVASPIIFGGY